MCSINSDKLFLTLCWVTFINGDAFPKLSSVIIPTSPPVKDLDSIPMSLSFADIIGTAKRSPKETILSSVLSLSSLTIITPFTVFCNSSISSLTIPETSFCISLFLIISLMAP